MTNTVKFLPPVKRINRGRYHVYEDSDGHRMPGVTTIIDSIAKPQLIAWAANATAEGAVNDWDNLAELPPAARLKALQGIRYEVTNRAKNKGTAVHRYAAAIVAGDELPNIDPPELRPYVENYCRFIDEWELDPLPGLIEATIASYSVGYAGTLDLVADLTAPSGERERYLLDVKTGERGVYPETAIQLAGYRFAEVYVAEDGNEVPMASVGIENTGAIHVTSDDAVLIPTVSGAAEFKTFRAAMHIYGHKQIEDGLVLPPMLHPGRSTARIVWADE